MIRWIGIVVAAWVLSACGQREAAPPTQGVAPAEPSPAVRSAIAAVDERRLLAADSEPQNWMTHGRTYDEQRFSPLDRIDADNVSGLELDWYFDFPTHRGIEATPIVVDGVMYVTASWSMLFALDAKTGEQLWFYDPRVPPTWAVHLCCDVVNRGVAVWQGRVYLGTLDGRLIALDAATGKVDWEVQTTPTDKPYSITGAPRIIDGKVIIGNGGAELGVRGYVSAYDAATGRQLWRFHTVPGNPADGLESKAMEMAVGTWKGGEWWKIGGGGTVWDSMAYDPELNLLYIGVGNGSPWNREIRSPGGGDNLFLSSIVALNPDSGEYVWHFQGTPGETWDYTATQHMILADLEIDGKPRKVIMQAPKNGFFYVLDRATGEFISAEHYVTVTWASGVEPGSGRPILTENARYTQGAQFTFPSYLGGHNWHPMSYSPRTRLVYVPVQDIPMVYGQAKDFVYRPGLFNLGIDDVAGVFPEDRAGIDGLKKLIRGGLLAWDPVAQKEVWRVDHGAPWNGGVLTTAGNLVFQGNANGELAAYRADTGERLWRADAQTGVQAAPISYAIDGKQYVAVAAGWGGAGALILGEGVAHLEQANRSRMLVYSLDGKAALPAIDTNPKPLPTPPPLAAGETTLAAGKLNYAKFCMGCHGNGVVGGGVLPDLRYMSAETRAQFDAIVLGGMRHARGMVGFAQWGLTTDDSAAILAYVTKRAHDLVAEASQGGAAAQQAPGEGK